MGKERIQRFFLASRKSFSSELMISVMNMWPGAWVIAMGGFAFSTAACGVTLLPAQKADAASAIQTLLEEAYLYAFPLVLVDATKTVSTNTKTASASRASL